MRLNLGRWISYQSKRTPRVVGIVAILILIAFAFFKPTFYQNFGSLVLSIVTIAYVVITYELVRITRENRPASFVAPEIIVISELDNVFLEQYSQYLSKDTRFKHIQKQSAQNNNQLGKNIVFLKAENVGDANSVEVSAAIVYKRETPLTGTGRVERSFNFGTIKKGDYRIEILEVYDNPSINDIFHLERCITTFNDVAGKKVQEKPHLEDSSTAIQFKADNGVVIKIDSPS